MIFFVSIFWSIPFFSKYIFLFLYFLNFKACFGHFYVFKGMKVDPEENVKPCVEFIIISLLTSSVIMFNSF